MTTEDTSRTPTLPELLRLSVEYYLQDVHTCLPGRIEEWDPLTQTATVKPLVQRLVSAQDGDEILEEIPIITNVPIAFPRNEKFFMTFPLKPGDLGKLFFTEASIDNWLASDGSDMNPDDFRRFDLTDAFFEPGLYPFSRVLKDYDADRMALGSDDKGMQIHIADDEIKVTFSNGSNLTLSDKDASAKLILGDGAVSATIFEALKPFFDAHIHPTGTGPSGPPAVAMPPSVGSTKIKMPSG